MHKRPFLASASLVIALAVATPACKGPILPAAANVIQVVLDDYKAGKSDSQIASDVCAALGGTSSTDAVCASTEVVLQDVVTYLIDAGLLSR